MSTTAARSEPFPLALGLSVVLHLLVLILAAAPVVRDTLAAWQAHVASLLPAPAPAAPQEVEIVVPVVTVEPPSPPPQSFIRTDGLAEATPAKPDSRFISDRNTRAATEQPAAATGPDDVPSQEGLDIPVVEILRTPLVDTSHDEEVPSPPSPADSQPPSPAVALAPPPPPEPTQETEPGPEPVSPPAPVDLERFATAPKSDFAVPAGPPDAPTTRPPKPATPSTAQRDSPARELRDSPPAPREATPGRPATPASPPRFSSLRVPTRQHGTITNRGAASIDAADTPVGRYMKQVTSAIEREWHRKRRVNADFVTYGTIQLEFTVNRQGKVQSLAIKNRNGANAIMQDFTLNAVLDALIPPMPPGLPEIIDHDGLQISYDIIVY